jgi:hypothetical protein
MAVSNDGKTVVITCMTCKHGEINREDTLEFWNAAGIYATTTIPLPRRTKNTINGIPPITHIFIDGEKAVAINTISCHKQLYFMGAALETYQYSNIHRFEFALANGKLLKSEIIPDRTVRELYWGKQKCDFWAALACAAVILCMLAGASAFFLIWRARRKRQSVPATPAA